MSYAIVSIDPDDRARMLADNGARTEITALFEDTEVAVVTVVETALDISRMVYVTVGFDAAGNRVWQTEADYYVVHRI